jgi:dCTP deaminase
MILSDRTLSQLLRRGELLYINGEPVYSAHIGPSSIDLTLGDGFVCNPSSENSGNVIDTKPMESTTASAHGHKYRADTTTLAPGEFLLAHTVEEVRLSAYHAAFVTGRSSIGRLGLQIENAGFIDPGFRGQITLELVNQAAKPIVLHAGIRICQFIIMGLDEPAMFPYKGKYLGQAGPTISKIEEDYL